MTLSNRPDLNAANGHPREPARHRRRDAAEELSQAKCELSELGQARHNGVSSLISRHPVASAAVGLTAGLIVLRWRGARTLVRVAAAWGAKMALRRMLRGS